MYHYAAVLCHVFLNTHACFVTSLIGGAGCIILQSMSYVLLQILVIIVFNF